MVGGAAECVVCSVCCECGVVWCGAMCCHLVFIPGQPWRCGQQEICKPGGVLSAAAHQLTGGVMYTWQQRVLLLHVLLLYLMAVMAL